MKTKSMADKPLINALEEIIALEVENQIKFEAWEQVFEKTNPLVRELYRGQVETLSKQKKAKLQLALTAALKEKLKKR